MPGDLTVNAEHINAVLTAARTAAATDGDMLLSILALAFAAACRSTEVHKFDGLRLIRQALNTPMDMATPAPGVH